MDVDAGHGAAWAGRLAGLSSSMLEHLRSRASADRLAERQPDDDPVID